MSLPLPFIQSFHYIVSLVYMMLAVYPFQLQHTEEIIGGKSTGNIGEVLIRCNNVLYIRGAPDEDDDGNQQDDSMQQADQQGETEGMSE